MPRRHIQHTMLAPMLIFAVGVAFAQQQYVHAFSTSNNPTEHHVPVASTKARKRTRRRKNSRRRSAIVPIISCSSGVEVKRVASHYLRPGDRILELGGRAQPLSHISAHIMRTVAPMGGTGVLVNVQHDGEAKSGRNGYRNPEPFLGSSHDTQQEESFVDQVEFLELDQFDDWRNLLPIENDEGSSNNGYYGCFDAVIINVGAMIGNDLHLTALSLANEFIKIPTERISETSSSAITPPRVVIVNSRSLSGLARRLCHGQQVMVDASKALPSSCEMQRSHEPYIIATVGVQEYRRTIPRAIQPGDHVLEVGCHSGMTTSMLHHIAAGAAAMEANTEGDNKDDDNRTRENGFCIGVDIGPKIIQSAKKLHPGVPFAVGDAWKTLQLLKLKDDHLLQTRPSSSSLSQKRPSSLGYDAVYADIGGLSGSDGLLESLSLLEALGRGLEPRCIVIKSLCIKRLASQIKCFTDVWERIRPREE